MFSDVIRAAERTAAGGTTPADLDDLARQVDSLDLAQPAAEQERARLAILLDFLGLRLKQNGSSGRPVRARPRKP